MSESGAEQDINITTKLPEKKPIIKTSLQTTEITDKHGELPMLFEEAEKTINKPIPLITDKNPGIIPPNASGHDYISASPYWYEGEDKPRDGEINPDAKKYPDPIKLGEAVNGVFITSLAAEQAIDPDKKKIFAEHAKKILGTWFVNEETKMTPSLEYAQIKPGEVNGNFYGIIDGALLIRVTEGVNKLKEVGLIEQETLKGVEDWFDHYLNWLLTSEKAVGKKDAGNEKEMKGERGMPNNHATFYDVQVAYIADFLGNSVVARETLEGVKERIKSQIEPSGEMPAETKRKTERIDVSNDYQIFNLYAFSELALLGQKYDIDLWNYETRDGRGLRKAYEYFVGRLKGAGNKPFKFDRTGELYLAFRAASKAYGDEEYWNLPTEYYKNPLVDEISQEMFRKER